MSPSCLNEEMNIEEDDLPDHEQFCGDCTAARKYIQRAGNTSRTDN